MKRIVIVRHATAVAHDPGADDFGRVLRKKGRREAARMAVWFAENTDSRVLLVSSPAARAWQTARAFAAELGVSKSKIVKSQTIYDAVGSDDLMGVIRELPDKHDTVVIFGHEPTLGALVSRLVPGFDEPLPKCGVYVVETARRKWGTLRSGDGEIAMLESPRGLRDKKQAAREAREALRGRIEDAVRGVLADAGVTPDQNDDAVRRASERLARKYS